MRIRAVAGGEFVGLSSGARTEALVSYADRAIPAGCQSPPHLAVSHVLRERRNHAVIHLKTLQLSPGVPVSRTPFDVQAIAASRQVARVDFSGKEIRILAVQVRTVVSGAADAKALANGIAEPTGPVAVLVSLKD